MKSGNQECFQSPPPKSPLLRRFSFAHFVPIVVKNLRNRKRKNSLGLS